MYIRWPFQASLMHLPNFRRRIKDIFNTSFENELFAGAASFNLFIKTKGYSERLNF